MRPLLTQRSAWVDTAVMLVGCFFPLSALVDLHFNFAYDWTVHLYNVAYFGEYFRQHLSFPSVINTDPLLGWALPVYYGSSFYSLCGLLSWFCGAAMAYRIFVVVMALIQYRLVRLVVGACGGDRFSSHAFALLVTWAIYPMTNLYNRSASTEYAAVILLNCGFCSWILLAGDTQKWKGTLLPWAFGFFFAMAAGSHPITALYGTITFFLYWLVTFAAAKEKKYLIKVTVFSGAAALLILLPWIYAVFKFRPFLQISAIAGKIWFSPAIDGFWTRLSPLPYDPRPPYDSTPHLDAQMSVSLLAFSVVALFLSRKKKIPRLAVVSGILFIVYFALSTCESIWNFIPWQYHIIQQAYRLVTYLNLTLLFLSVSLMPNLAGRPRETGILRRLLLLCLAVSALAVGLKLYRARDVNQWTNFPGLVHRDPPVLLYDIPFGVQNMARNAYVTDALFGHDPQKFNLCGTVRIPVSRAPSRFGETETLRLTAPVECWILTNVQAFPWNKVIVDEKPASSPPDGSADVIESNNLLAVKIQAGPHKFGYVFAPDVCWVILRHISGFGTIAWTALLLLLFLKTGFRISGSGRIRIDQ